MDLAAEVCFVAFATLAAILDGLLLIAFSVLLSLLHLVVLVLLFFSKTVTMVLFLGSMLMLFLPVALTAIFLKLCVDSENSLNDITVGLLEPILVIPSVIDDRMEFLCTFLLGVGDNLIVTAPQEALWRVFWQSWQNPQQYPTVLHAALDSYEGHSHLLGKLWRFVPQRMLQSQNISGETPLAVFLTNSRTGLSAAIALELVKCFLKKGSNAMLQIPDKEGYLPLHRACGNSNLDLPSIQLLVDAYPGALLRRAGVHLRLPHQLLGSYYSYYKEDEKRTYLQDRILHNTVYQIAKENNVPDEVTPLILDFADSMDL